MAKGRLRKDVRKLTTQERDTLVRAFQHIISLPPDDPNSYFIIAGYHGLPLPQYCFHGVVLFPTWHRAYLLRLEEALRSAPGCGDLALPYWDEVSSETKEEGLPNLFTDKSYTFQDGTSIPNPLFSYQMQQTVVDEDDEDGYTKPEGYKTVRYPYSGLVSGKWKDQTALHNETVDKNPPEEVTRLLNENIKRWLFAQTFKNHEGKVIAAGEADNYVKCLDAPNYTIFSNTTSAAAHNGKHKNESTERPVIPLEQPHNALHLAVGGFDVPGQGNFDVYPFANGDMGENDTAGFDPVFFFHHCFIDYTFWKWQERHNSTDKLDLVKGDPGTEIKNDQGQVTGYYTLDTPLVPFKTTDRSTGAERDTTSNDVVNIADLGYTYTEPGRDGRHGIMPGEHFVDAPKLAVDGINRGKVSGSFIISTWAKTEDGQPDRLISTKAVLSRWNVAQCDNCRSHLDVKSFVHLTDFSHEEASNTTFYAKIHTREKPEGDKNFGGRQIPIALKACKADGDGN